MKTVVIIAIFILMGFSSCENKNYEKQYIRSYKPLFIEKEHMLPTTCPYSVSANTLGGYSVKLTNDMYFRRTDLLVLLDNKGNKTFSYKNDVIFPELHESTKDIDVFSDSSILVCNVYNIMEIDPNATLIHLYKYDKYNKLLWDKKTVMNAAPLCRPLIAISPNDEILIASEAAYIYSHDKYGNQIWKTSANITKLDKDGNEICESNIDMETWFIVERFRYAKNGNLYLSVDNVAKEGFPIINSKIYEINSETGQYILTNEDFHNDSILFLKDFEDISLSIITDTLNNTKLNNRRNGKTIWETILFSEKTIYIKDIYKNTKNEIYIIGDDNSKIFISHLSQNGEIIETKIFHKFHENYETIHSEKHTFMVISSKKKDGEQNFNTLSVIMPNN